MTTQCDKAFKGWWKQDKRFGFLAPTGTAKMVWKAAWKARGEHDAKICEGLNEPVKGHDNIVKIPALYVLKQSERWMNETDHHRKN
jgi:hypothetical protein